MTQDTEAVAIGIDGSRRVYVRNADGSWPALPTRIEAVRFAPLGMSGGVPAGERRDQIADIIAEHVSGPVVQDWDIQQSHRQDQLTAADKIVALFATPTPPIEGRDADVERVIANVLEVYDRSRGHESLSGMFRLDDIRALLAALQALGERG